MSFEIGTSWLLTVVLVTIRMGILFYATPFDAMGRLPVQIRIYASFVLAMILVSGLNISALTMPGSVFELAMLGLQEALVGLIMAFGLYCVFGSIMVGGKLIDFQAGFGAAQILNPATNTSSPLVGTVISLLAVLLFFLSDAYLLALRGIAYSLEVSPPGSGFSLIPIDAIVKQFGLVYIYGFIIAAPVIGILLLLDTAIAVMGRTMPQMNVYFLFLPLKIGSAVGLSAVAVRYLSPLLERMFLDVFQYWQRVLG
ncbi:MAG: flagellar biosynthetic protein FliR [Halioglobus sp.]|jgi:flagellar biosynthetic protein FliR